MTMTDASTLTSLIALMAAVIGQGQALADENQSFV